MGKRRITVLFLNLFQKARVLRTKLKRSRLQIDTKYRHKGIILVFGKKKITVRSSFGICYKLDRRCKASLNNTFSLGLDLGAVVIGGESS